MTETRCWVEYKSDHALQRKVKEDWFTDEKGFHLPIASFPGRPRNSLWPIALQDWTGMRGIAMKDIDGVTFSARVKRDQLLDFINFVYADDPSYTDPAQMLTWKGRAFLAHQLIDLRAFVTQELNARLWYDLMADMY